MGTHDIVRLRGRNEHMRRIDKSCVQREDIAWLDFVCKVNTSFG